MWIVPGGCAQSISGAVPRLRDEQIMKSSSQHSPGGSHIDLCKHR